MDFCLGTFFVVLFFSICITMEDIKELVSLGEKLGYSGEKLQEFVKVELERLDMKKKEDREREDRAAEREDRRRMDEEKLKMEEMAHLERMQRLEYEAADKNLQLAQLKHDDDHAVKSFARTPKLPTFQEGKDDLDAYLGRFERYADTQKWPRDRWATNLSALLTGKALETYYRLPKEDIDNYDCLKDALLRRFQLTEEEFRQKFYNAKAEPGETAHQYMTRLEGYIDRWIQLSETPSTFDGLRDLITKEQFIDSCHKELATFLRERKLKDRKEVLKTADKYQQAHGGNLSAVNKIKPHQQQQKRDEDRRICHKCGKEGHIAPKCRSSNTSQAAGQEVSDLNQLVETRSCHKCGIKGHIAPNCRATQPPVSERTCFLCGRKGHMAKYCRSFDKPSQKTAAGLREENGSTLSTPENSETTRTCTCSCARTQPTCFITVLKDVEADFDDMLVKGNDGTEYPVCHMRCKQPIPMCTCHGLPTAKAELNGHPVVVMRDTGCSGVVVRSEFVNPDQYTGQNRLCLLVDGTVRKVPVAEVSIDTPYYVGNVEAMVMPTPIYDLILGNIPGCREADNPDHDWAPMPKTTCREDHTYLVDDKTAAVLTRSQIKKKERQLKPIHTPDLMIQPTQKQQDFADEQRRDETLRGIWKKAEENTGPHYTKTAETSFEIKNGMLHRIYRKNKGHTWTTTKQIVLPQGRRNQCLRLAHEALIGGHMGVQKTMDRILSKFYWPGMHNDVSRFCKSCDICQRTIQKGRISKVPLDQMPMVDVPFKRIAVDLIGPIYPVSENGNRYILTVVDYATRYPEAIALPSIETTRVAEALLDIYSRVGFPEEVLSDLGTQFTSSMMKEVSRLISVTQLNTSPYHPCCNGLVEKFNGTLKIILKRLCSERPKDWDRYISAVLFSYREVPQESTGFAPFELLYGRDVRGPMEILKEIWVKERSSDEEEPSISYQYVIDLRNRIEKTCEIAQSEIQKSSKRYKKYYDRNTKPRYLKPGDQALILLPTDNNKLLLQWKGPFKVLNKVGKNDYSVDIKGKPRTFHINMLKQYISREENTEKEDAEISSSVLEFVTCGVIEDDLEEEQLVDLLIPQSEETYKDVKYSEELTDEQRKQVQDLVHDYQDIFTDRPGTTDLEEHRIELTTEEPIRQKPYPVPYAMRETLREEVRKMLEADIIEHTNSPYASPVVLVKKPDGSNRFCIDFRKLNRITIFDGEPMPTVDDILVKLKNDVYFSKFDLSKGYWQIPLHEQDKVKTAFTTPDGNYQFKKMPFGLVNASATFNRMMRKALCHVPNSDSFVDDMLAHTGTWDTHMATLKTTFEMMRQAHLTVRPSKCFIGHKTLDFVGHKIGEGNIQPQSDKVKKILEASQPTTKREVRAFIGLAGYYRNFIPNFSSIAVPLTDLTKKGSPNSVNWETKHQEAFDKLKSLITQEPILKMPDFSKTFYVQTDASDYGAGAALLQEHDEKKHPVAFFSKKFSTAERAYSTVEKECLALVWAVRKFHVYLYGVEFVLETDHEPLTFIDRAKMTNSRIMRWSLMLQSYRFRLNAIKGSDNVIADYLSRSVER